MARRAWASPHSLPGARHAARVALPKREATPAGSEIPSTAGTQGFIKIPDLMVGCAFFVPPKGPSVIC